MGEMVWAPSKWKFSLVVAGTIEWRTQHPYWFQKIGILNDEETAAAIPTIMVSPMLVGFQAKEFSLVAIPDRWEISTELESGWDRVINIARQVFDSVLTETGISAFGINTNILIGGPLASTVGRVLAETFDLPREGQTFGQFAFRNERKDESIAMVIATLPDGSVELAYNVHHPIVAKHPDKVSTFIFGDLLDGTAKNDWRAGMEFLKKFSLRFNVAKEV
jgi:hypothetical protein